MCINFVRILLTLASRMTPGLRRQYTRIPFDPYLYAHGVIVSNLFGAGMNIKAFIIQLLENIFILHI